MPGSNPLAQSPFTPFRAYVTAVTTGTGAQAGMYLYTFKEQSFDPASGANLDANPGRQTNPLVGTPISGYAFEINNDNVTPPFYAEMHFMGVVAGVPVYEFANPLPTPAVVLDGGQVLGWNDRSVTTTPALLGQTTVNPTGFVPSVTTYVLTAQLSGYIQLAGTAFGSNSYEEYIVAQFYDVNENIAIGAQQVVACSFQVVNTVQNPPVAHGSVTLSARWQPIDSSHLIFAVQVSLINPHALTGTTAVLLGYPGVSSLPENSSAFYEQIK